jgi:hypothetical protein
MRLPSVSRPPVLGCLVLACAVAGCGGPRWAGGGGEAGASREANVAALEARIAALEERLAAAGGGAPLPVAPSRPALPPPGAAARGPDGPDRGAGVAAADEDAIDRALERALVQTGALLLPPGTVEVEPFAAFSRDERTAPAIVRVPGGNALGQVRDRRTSADGGFAVRAGLPFDAQAQVRVPFGYEGRSTVDEAGFGRLAERDEDRTGLGDVVVGLSKGLLRERGLLPELVAAVEWDTRTGGDDDLTAGSGFDEVSASLTATRRADPLVFVGALGYERAFERDGVRPGDEISATLGTVLATSPDTSLRFLLTQSFRGDTELRGADVPGTDRVATTLTLGGSVVLTDRALLDVSAGIGVTDDAPDFSFRVAVPIRVDFDRLLRAVGR